jgi:hypothetical protein
MGYSSTDIAALNNIIQSGGNTNNLNGSNFNSVNNLNSGNRFNESNMGSPLSSQMAPMTQMPPVAPMNNYGTMRQSNIGFNDVSVPSQEQKMAALAKRLEEANEKNNSDTKSKTKIKLLLLGVIIALSVACSMAWNEVAKYYISRSIKFYRGTPLYFVYYASAVTFVTLILYGCSVSYF